MKSFDADKDRAGDFVAPFALNNEFAEMFGVIHSLDVYNFAAASIPVLKLETGAAGDIRIVPITTVDIVNVQASASTGDVNFIPASGGLPWVEQFPSGDGVLSLSFSCSLFNTSTFQGIPAWVGLRVDGVLVAQSGTYTDDTGNTTCLQETFVVTAMVPVGGGTHTIEPVFGMYINPAFVLQAIEFSERVLVIREIAR